jgi:hypothetical protein
MTVGQYRTRPVSISDVRYWSNCHQRSLCQWHTRRQNSQLTSALPTSQTETTKKKAEPGQISDTSGITSGIALQAKPVGNFVSQNTRSSHGFVWALMYDHLSTWCIHLNSTAYLLTQDQMKTDLRRMSWIPLNQNAIAFNPHQVRVSIMSTWFSSW